ncbi:MAG: YggT family protein [Aquificae bacterium]|nr:YggT family protein [Aquificota bacterium]
MLIVANLLEAVARILDIALSLYMWVVFISAVISWVNPDPHNQIVRFLRGITEPVYRVIRRYIPTNFGGIDLAPMVVIFGILFIKYFLVQTLLELAYKIKLSS